MPENTIFVTCTWGTFQIDARHLNLAWIIFQSAGYDMHVRTYNFLDHQVTGTGKDAVKIPVPEPTHDFETVKYWEHCGHGFDAQEYCFLFAIPPA